MGPISMAIFTTNITLKELKAYSIKITSNSLFVYLKMILKSRLLRFRILISKWQYSETKIWFCKANCLDKDLNIILKRIFKFLGNVWNFQFQILLPKNSFTENRKYPLPWICQEFAVFIFLKIEAEWKITEIIWSLQNIKIRRPLDVFLFWKRDLTGKTKYFYKVNPENRMQSIKKAISQTTN